MGKRRVRSTWLLTSRSTDKVISSCVSIPNGGRCGEIYHSETRCKFTTGIFRWCLVLAMRIIEAPCNLLRHMSVGASVRSEHSISVFIVRTDRARTVRPDPLCPLGPGPVTTGIYTLHFTPWLRNGRFLGIIIIATLSSRKQRNLTIR